MEHKLRQVLMEDLVHASLIADTRHDGLSLNIRELLTHQQAHIMLRRLSLVNQNQGGWMIDGNLPDHLRTDTTGSTGDQDTLASQQLTDRVHIHTDLITWQQVFQRHLTHLHILKSLVLIAGLHLHRILRHEDLHAGTQQDILYFLVVTELIRT